MNKTAPTLSKKFTVGSPVSKLAKSVMMSPRMIAAPTTRVRYVSHRRTSDCRRSRSAATAAASRRISNRYSGNATMTAATASCLRPRRIRGVPVQRIGKR